MSSQSKKTFGNDPLDPWADHGPYFDSKEIKKSKTGGVVHHADYLNAKTPHGSKREKSSFGIKVKTTLGQFRDREDIHRIYRSFIIIIILISAISFLAIFVIMPWIKEVKKNIDENAAIQKATALSDEVIMYEEGEMDSESIESKLLHEIENEGNSRSIRISATVLLADIYSYNERFSEAIEMLEKELETAETLSEKVQLMACLSNIYKQKGDNETAITILEQILSYPETENIEFNGLTWPGIRETYLEEYNRMKNE